MATNGAPEQPTDQPQGARMPGSAFNISGNMLMVGGGGGAALVVVIGGSAAAVAEHWLVPGDAAAVGEVDNRAFLGGDVPDDFVTIGKTATTVLRRRFTTSSISTRMISSSTPAPSTTTSTRRWRFCAAILTSTSSAKNWKTDGTAKTTITGVSRCGNVPVNSTRRSAIREGQVRGPGCPTTKRPRRHAHLSRRN